MNVRDLIGSTAAMRVVSGSSLTRRKMLGGMAGLGAAAAVAPRLTWAQSATPAASTPTANDGTWAVWTKFNLNSITSEQILTIPGAGDKMTHEFPEYRPYTTILQFRQEIGKYVGDDVTAGYEKYVFVPIDPTQVDDATLATLPGVDAILATQLAKGVPYASDDAFLQAVAAVVSTDHAASIPTYLASKAQSTVNWVKLNLNTASDDQFKTIPGVTDDVLKVFDASKPYASIKAFRDETGKAVDASVVAGYEAYVYVPVDATQADAETLAQLPGVNDDVAAELMKSAPFTSNDAFLQALAAVVSPDQAAAAAAFMAS
jgi:DNA uptake protein ComE-like DNA-binding protein